MVLIEISGFFSESNPDNSLQYERDVPQVLETAVLNVMGWSTLKDVPMGEHDLTPSQSMAIMSILNTSYRSDLLYCMGLCSND